MGKSRRTKDENSDISNIIFFKFGACDAVLLCIYHGREIRMVVMNARQII